MQRVGSGNIRPQSPTLAKMVISFWPRSWQIGKKIATGYGSGDLRRNMASSDVYDRCALDTESILHYIRDCPKAKADRNNDVFNPLEPWSVSRVNGLCLSLNKDLQHALHAQPSITHQSLLSFWIPPSGTQVKLNCDASFFPNLNSAGFDCVIRDPLGNWAIGSAGHILETSGLRLARLSCQVDGANSRDLIPKIHELLSRNWTVDVELIQRTANQRQRTPPSPALGAQLNIRELRDLIQDKYAIMCVQHDYTPKETTNMDVAVQTVYPRKNWSSMVLYNCGHSKNRVLRHC
ncbi:hypothetical protein PIB30_074919 [Stylosanthes scabra]|uniref:Uncharacterized protein n=1 Tax=Stylosanthes scabra TaxID=79078 RepID=A0ABU6XND5_9FABA|nr:hypothetical protein [Stylosanthes scabra]